MFWILVSPCSLALPSQPWQPASSSRIRKHLVWALSIPTLVPWFIRPCSGIAQGTFSMGHIDVTGECKGNYISGTALTDEQWETSLLLPPEIDICEHFLWFSWEGFGESTPPSSIVVSNPILLWFGVLSLSYCRVPVLWSLTVPHTEVGSLRWGMSVI